MCLAAAAAALPAIGTALTSTAGMAVTSAALAGIGLYAQHQSAKAQAAALEAQAEAERRETLERNEEELGQRVRAAREARARARVAAGESGAMGQSFAAMLNQSLQDQDMDAALVAKNVAFSQRATNDRLATALSGIRSPSALEAGLQIATAGISGFQTGLAIRDARKGKTSTTN